MLLLLAGWLAKGLGLSRHGTVNKRGRQSSRRLIPRWFVRPFSGIAFRVFVAPWLSDFNLITISLWKRVFAGSCCGPVWMMELR